MWVPLCNYCWDPDLHASLSFRLSWDGRDGIAVVMAVGRIATRAANMRSDLSRGVKIRAKDLTAPNPEMNIGMVKTKPWFLYLLRCSDGSHYTGITTDVKRRSEQHNAGTASRYTRSRLPVRVMYQEPHASRNSASMREWAVKAMTRSEKESLIRLSAQRIR